MGKFYENEMEKLREYDLSESDSSSDYAKKKKEQLERLNKAFNEQFYKAKIGGRVTLMGGGKDFDSRDTIEGTIVAVHHDLQMFEVDIDTHNGKQVKMDGYMRVFAEMFGYGFDVLLFD